MGIAFSLIRLSPDAVETLRGEPKAVAEFVYQDPEAYEEPKTGFFGRLFGTSKVSEELAVPERTEGDEADLDKAWHIVHYLLCGDPERGEGPLALIGDDLHPLADIDVGLGKPNVISAEAVQAFASAAAGMTDEMFLRRYIPDEMPLDKLYLGEAVARGDVDDIRGYVVDNFHTLRDFVQQAADRREAIITYYS